MKRKLAILLILAIIVGLLSACAGDKDTSKDQEQTIVQEEKQEEKQEGKQEEEVEVEERPLLKITTAAPADERRDFWINEDIVDFIRENFGIEFEYEWYAEYRDNVVALMVAGNYPEYFLERPGSSEAKHFGAEGHAVAINENEDKLPNLRSLYTDEEWAYVLARDMAPDGNVYAVPYKENLILADGTFIYRKDVFDQLGLEFPKTTDEFLEVLRILKEEKGVAPYVDKNELDAAQRALAPSFRTRRTYLVDEDYDNKVVMGPTTDKYRDLLRFTRRLIDEGLLEFYDYYEGGRDEYEDKILTDQIFIIRDRPVKAEELNAEMREENPNVEWAFVDWIMEAYPGKPGWPDKGNPNTGTGPIITDKASEEKVERLFEFIDWLCTKEGRIFQNFGIEGKSFVYENDLVKWMDHIKHPNNPDGTVDYRKYSLARGHRTYYVPSEWTVYEPDAEELLNLALKDAVFVKHVPAIVKPEEYGKYDEITEPVRKMTQEYTIAYLKGEYDDTSWDEYISNLNRAGYEEARSLYEMAYDRYKDLYEKVRQ